MQMMSAFEWFRNRHKWKDELKTMSHFSDLLVHEVFEPCHLSYEVAAAMQIDVERTCVASELVHVITCCGGVRLTIKSMLE